jgi:Spy/CpxP family protein refolding chaperone
MEESLIHQTATPTTLKGSSDEDEGGQGGDPEGRSRKMRSLIVASLAAVLLWMPSLRADEEQPGQPHEGLTDLKLTQEQDAKIADIRKEFRPRVEQASKELATLIRTEVDKIQQVLTTEQKEKLASMKEERRERRAAALSETIAHLEDLEPTDAEMAKIAEIRNEFRPRARKSLERLRGILTPEQQKAREEGLRAGRSRREVMASLKLTGDQQEKVEAVGKELADTCREEMQKIRDVLTESQKEQLQDVKEERRERVRDRMAHRIANLRELNLTEEQRTKIAAIRQEFRPRIHEAGNKLRATVREELDNIVSALKA